MKKIISLLLVLVLLLAIPGSAFAAAPSKARLHKTRIIAMRRYADSMVGKSPADEVCVLSNPSDSRVRIFSRDNQNTVTGQSELVVRKTIFIRRLLSKAGFTDDLFTANQIYAHTKKVKRAIDGAIMFNFQDGSVCNLAMFLNGYQYYVNSLNKVVREKYSSKDWNYIGIIPGL